MSHAARPALTLADLPLGGLARVVGIRQNGPMSDRLRELGLCPGTEVRFTRKAPLGDPLVFTLRGYQLSIRRKEAARVEIERIQGEV